MTKPIVAGVAAEVAVVGAGPAGIAAAAAAAECGARVVLVDEGIRPGGQIWRHTERSQLPRVARQALERLDRSGAAVLSGTTVLGVSPGGALLVGTGSGPGTVEASAVVLATGARERFLPFPGWTLPNVMGVGGAQALLKSGADFAGRRVVVAGSGPLLFPVAATLSRAGAEVALVAEQAPARRVVGFGMALWRSPGRVLQAAGYRLAFRHARYRPGSWIMRAEGDAVVRNAVLTNGRDSWSEDCDLLCVGYDLIPNTELARLLGCAVEGERVVVDEWQATTVEGVYCAGEATSIGGMEAARVEGEIAGLAACGRPEAARRLRDRRARHQRFAARLERSFALRGELRQLPQPDTVVCRCEDVTCERFRPHWTARQAKLYTRAGMGSCQGRVCGPALQFLFGWRPDTVRAPLVPATVGTLHQFSEPEEQC